MSWSDDTRCLYCEGRLPLYRKITHGQFCSSAHRKSYWQEHERLAVERLQQTHSSLRSYRSLEVPQEVPQEAVPYPNLEPVTRVRVASQPELETNLELDPAPSFDVNLYRIPDTSEPPVAADELLSLLSPNLHALGGNSPDLIAADPFEYESTLQPLSPSHSSSLETSPLPEGLPVAVLSYLGSRPSGIQGAAAGASVESEVELRHPGSQKFTVEMRTADRVGLPEMATLESRPTPIGSSLRVLDMEPSPITSVELGVSLQSDVLLQLLDQQIPHPDELYPLNQFAPHQSPLVLACPPPEEELDATAEDVLPAQGNLVSHNAISEIAAKSHTGMLSAAMPAVAQPAHQMRMAELQNLGLKLPRPVQGRFVIQTRDSEAPDLLAGVSSDVTFPDLARSSTSTLLAGFDRMLPLTFAKRRKPVGETTRLETMSRVLPETVEIDPMLPQSGLEPLDRKPIEDSFRTPESGIGSVLRREGLKKLEPAWAHASGFWHHAPRDLKLLLFAIPALLALVFHPGLPRIAFAAPRPSAGLTGGFTDVINGQWTSVRTTLEHRAAVALDEDFRSGLDNWASPGGSTTEWSFDPTGFVRPGPLALYRPSVGLADYQVQFLGLIDKKALSWVVRAADFENFYVVKLQMVKSGPIPAIALTRYAVINGEAQDRHDVNIPIDLRTDTVYRVRMDVHGSDFAVEVQGQMADSWTDTRLPRGGIGFFTASGEASRLRWVQITHQYDMLGRLCAYLAPYDTTNGSWQP